MVSEKLRAHLTVVDAFGDANQAEGREAIRLGDRELQT